MNADDLSSFVRKPEILDLLHRLSSMGLDLPAMPEDMQREWSLPFMRWVVAETTSGMQAQLSAKDRPGIVVGTHRDIVCDPALYNLARVESGRDTTHIVLGSNLAGHPWVKQLMVLNKAIFIDRTAKVRAAWEQQQKLSERIANIVQGGGTVWIAQAPGRAKSGLDKTHPGLLKMLGLAWGSDSMGPAALDGLLRPLVIRYDKNPCDALIVKERLLGQKVPGDDEASMRLGLLGQKGRVQLWEGDPIHTGDLEQRKDWSIVAERLDEAMASSGIHGEWSRLADPVPEAFTSRLLHIQTALADSCPAASLEQLKLHLLEVYRES